jgi:capsular exopolysaccharide synthesis family protein
VDIQIEKEQSLRDLVRIYRRRKSVVYGITATIVVLVALYCLVCTRRYEATGLVQVQKQGMDAMGLEDLMSGASGDDSNPLSANIEIQTQANILQSDTLALRTIEELKLEKTDDFRGHWNPVSWVVEKVSPKGVGDPPGVTLEDAPQRRAKALKVFSKNLKVKPITGTRIIEIDYSNPDPKLAAAVVNTLTKGLSDYAYQTRFEATNQASRWLGDQMGDLRKASEDMQAKVVSLERESGIYSFGTTDAQGREQAYSGVLDQLQQTTVALNTATQNRILKGAIAKAAETGDAEMLSGLAGNSLSGGLGGTSNSLTLIQGLRQQEATEQAALKEAEVKYGPAFPKLAELRGNIAGIDHSIQAEIGRIKGRAASDYNIGLQAEETSRKAYENAKRDADILNNKAIEYAIVRQEAEQSRGLYEDLLKRLKEAGVLEGLKSSNITLIDPGRAPAKPKTPNVPVYMTLALIGGWVVGCCGAFLTDNLDNKIISVDDVEDMFKLSPLGVLPKIELPPGQADPTKRILALADPASTYVEALRSIRTALLLTQTDAPPKTILVTSSIAGEGKSFCSLNLAIILAQSGRRTLILDTDLRRGTLRQKLGLPYSPGLSDLLAGQQTTPPILRVPGIDNLDVLLAGATPPNPTDLLESEAMKTWLQKFRSEYDFVVLDSAPVLPVTDSVALNTLTDATLLIVRSRVSERPQAQRSFQLLRRDGRHYVGLILNGMDVNDSSYYGYHGYRRYGYRYSEENGREV